MKFTGHNIQLNNGEQTRPGNQLLADSAFMTAIKRTVINITGTDKEQYSELKLVDLACMEGGYATWTEAGYRVEEAPREVPAGV